MTTIAPPSAPVAVDFEAIKTKQQATWASGGYSKIGTTLQIVGERLCESVEIEAGWRVLDVAAGNGNAALAAARRNAIVTASDYVPALLSQASDRAAASGLTLTTEVADAECLPTADRSWDAVLSVFGVMFTPQQAKAASELIRVCRAGGRIGLANWTPDSFVAHMFATISRHVTPPPVDSVFRWGDAALVRELLGAEVRIESAEVKVFTFRYCSAEDFVETFRSYYGPTNRAFNALDPGGQDALEHDLITLVNDHNVSTGGALAVRSNYLEVVATRL